MYCFTDNIYAGGFVLQNKIGTLTSPMKDFHISSGYLTSFYFFVKAGG